METITPRGGGANTAQPENMAMSPEIWRYVFDTIEDPAFLHDAQFRVMLANRAYCRAAGVTEAQALGKPYWEVFPRGTGPMPGCKDAIIGKGHDGSQEEANVGGKLFFSRGYTVRAAQDKPLYALHVLSDITAQRQAEATLAGSEERSRRATETARDAIIIIDGESGAVTAWNPAVEVMFGYDKEEVIGRVLHEIITPPRFRAVATKAMAHFSTTGEGAAIDQTLELVALHKNGTEFPIELSLSATQIGGKWQATGIVRDISERKKADSHVAAQLDELRRWHDATLGREGRVLELKHEINQLLAQAGQPPRYPSAESLNPKEA